jgi:hypothetical protein
MAPDRIVLEEGSIPTDDGQVHVDCSAAGLRLAPARPVFAGRRITVQQIRACQPAFNAALVGYVEATRHDDAEQNLLCPPNPYPDTATDWIPATFCRPWRPRDCSKTGGWPKRVLCGGATKAARDPFRPHPARRPGIWTGGVTV